MPDEPTIPAPRHQPPGLSAGDVRRELLRAAGRPEVEGYEIREPLGEGGMGTVWLAVQKSTRREVALKLMSESRLGSDKIRQRFEREVELAARLEHPNIARVYDSGVDRGVYFYAMECVKGVPLDQYVEDRKLARHEILQLMQKVCEAIQHAHRNGVIHRDLKFNNILVSEDGEPHVLDFGLAKPLELDEKGMSLSLDGDVLGTPWFMSPEQASGKAREADTRADVYSLGVMLYYLLTGVFPHDIRGSAWEVMKRVAEEEPQRPRAVDKSIDADLEALLLKALQREPEQRYENGGHLANDIANYLAGNPLMAQPATTMYFLKKRIRKNRVPLAIAAAVATVLLGMAAYSFLRVSQERNLAVVARTDAEQQRDRTQAALEKLSSTAPAFHEQALFLRDQNRPEDALKAISTAIELNPDEPEYHLLAGHLCQIMLRFEEAASFYREVLRLASGHASAQENLPLSTRLAVQAKDTNVSSDEIFFELRSEQMLQGRSADVITLDHWINREAVPPATPEGAGQSTHSPQDMPWNAHKFTAHWNDKLRKTGLGRFADLKVYHYLDTPLMSLELQDDSLTNLTPLARIPLERLAVSSSNVTDLSPLVRLPLKMLDIRHTRVRDLSPLRGIRLEALDISKTSVTSLSPLQGMRSLKSLVISSTAIRDLSPLRGIPLVFFAANQKSLKDLGPLAGMPLTCLDLKNSGVQDLSPLRGMSLTNLNIIGTPVCDLEPLKGMPLVGLVLSETGVEDLTPLKGMRLQWLHLSGTKVKNLEGLQGMPLAFLGLDHTQVQDLNPLAGMPLYELHLDFTPVSDLRPLAGPRLSRLSLYGCQNLRDLAPLTNCPSLNTLSIPPQHENINSLRQMPRLTWFFFNPLKGGESDRQREKRDQFWARYDAEKMTTGGQLLQTPMDFIKTQTDPATDSGAIAENKTAPGEAPAVARNPSNTNNPPATNPLLRQLPQARLVSDPREAAMLPKRRLGFSVGMHLHARNYVPAAHRSNLIDGYYDSIKQNRYSWSDQVQVLVAIIRAQFPYPPDQLQVVPFLDYLNTEGQMLGQVPLAIREVPSGHVLLAAFVSPGNNPNSVQKRITRFKTCLESGDPIWLRAQGKSKQVQGKFIFSANTKYITIGLQGARARGFDCEIDITLEELEQLRQRLLQNQRQGKKAE